MTEHNELTRRQFLAVTAATAATAAVAGFPGTGVAQDKPSSMVYSTYGGDFGNWMKQSFEVPFTQATGIELQHAIGTNPARYTKLSNYRSNPRFQLINLQDRYLYKASREGLLETIDYSNVPHADTIPETFKSPSWFGYMNYNIGLVYNKNNVKNPPQTWEDLLDKQYKGRIFLDAFTHFGLHTLVAMSFANGGSYENMSPGFELIREIAVQQNPRFITTSQQGMRLLRTGQVDIAPWQNTRAFLLQRDGYPIRYAVPNSGDVAIVYGNGIVKNSGYKKWSEKFLDYTANPEYQANLVSKYYPATPTNTEAEPIAEVAQLIARPEQATQFTLDYAEVLPRLSDWQRRWNKAIARG